MKSVDAGPAGDVERLYRDDGARLWRAILFLSGDPEIANDAVAEAFAQALARGSEIRSLRAWVWKAAFLIANGQLKERRRAPPQTGPDFRQFPEATVELVEALRTLSPRQRSSVILHIAGDGAAARIHHSHGRGAPSQGTTQAEGLPGGRRWLT